MPSIAADADHATFINTFDVDPADQAEILAALVETMGAAQRHPGFISASAHPTLDGRRIFMYLQWRTAQDLLDYQASTEFRALTPRFAGVAGFTSQQCRVAHVAERTRS